MEEPKLEEKVEEEGLEQKLKIQKDELRYNNEYGEGDNNEYGEEEVRTSGHVALQAIIAGTTLAAVAAGVEMGSYLSLGEILMGGLAAAGAGNLLVYNLKRKKEYKKKSRN